MTRAAELPDLKEASLLEKGISRCYIGAYGFEERSLGWTNLQAGQGHIIQKAYIFRYVNEKGKNKVEELKKNLKTIGGAIIEEIQYDLMFPHKIEEQYDLEIMHGIANFDEIILDITAMTKFLILVSLCKLMHLHKNIRIVYSEAQHYAPIKSDYEKSKKQKGALARFPNRGFGSIVRAKCLSSVRMQGQPVTIIAFTSFNEQLIQHMLGTISPHRLIFINGRPPRKEFCWRELATEEIHKKLIEEFAEDNPGDSRGHLTSIASSLYYKETIERIEEIYEKFGMHERIMVTATGSKMQTIGLFFAKALHPDIHIEYPTPDSYFVKRMSQGIRKTYEIALNDFAGIISKFTS